MSGCVEDILVDLSEPEPVREPPGCSVDNLLNLSGPERGHEGIHVTDSMELFRADKGESQLLVQIDSPLVPDAKLVESLQRRSPPTLNKLNDTFETPTLDMIETETFDFDLPVTPSTISERSSSVEDLAENGEEDEEEVFFGPVGFRERCAATVVDSATKTARPLSPLNERQMAEIFKEATAVANRISSAVTNKKSKSIKDRLTCSKQLNLGKKPAIFSPEAIGKLLKSVTKTSISDEAEAENKENAFTRDSVFSVTSSDHTDSLAIVDVMYKNMKMEQEKERSSGSEKEKSSGSEADGPDTPSRRHNRSGTYTVSKTPHEKLPANKRKSLPVVAKNSTVCDSGKKDVTTSETKRPTKKRSLQPPSRLSRGGTSKLQGPAPKKPHISSSPPEPQEPSKPSQESSARLQPPKTAAAPVEPNTAAPKETQLKPRRSGLQAPKGCSALPSKLKIPGAQPVVTTTATAAPVSTATSTKTSNIPATKSIPQKSSIPGLRGKNVPISKLQLMKPSGLQRPAASSQAAKVESSTNQGSTKKAGPMKAFNPAVSKVPNTAEKKKVADVVTPGKEEKRVRPKNLLSQSFSTPKSGSTSSMDSPVSSVNKRRSFLPTPNKSRSGSTASAPSPCISRLSSTSSVESPLIRSASKRRPSSTTKSSRPPLPPHKSRRSLPVPKRTTRLLDYMREAIRDNQSGPLIDFDDSSPSAMRPKRTLVTNTPNLPRKKYSPWSPVVKQKLDIEEQAIMCTKKLRK